MVIQNTYPNLSNIVHTDFELGRVIQTVGAADPGITVLSTRRGQLGGRLVKAATQFSAQGATS